MIPVMQTMGGKKKDKEKGRGKSSLSSECSQAFCVSFTYWEASKEQDSKKPYQYFLITKTYSDKEITMYNIDLHQRESRWNRELGAGGGFWTSASCLLSWWQSCICFFLFMWQTQIYKEKSVLPFSWAHKIDEPALCKPFLVCKTVCVCVFKILWRHLKKRWNFLQISF